MVRQWTFGQKLTASIVVLVALAFVIGIVSFVALGSVVSTKDRVIDVDAELLIDAQQAYALRESKASDARAFLLTANEQFIDRMQRSRAELVGVLDRIQRS